MKDKILKFIYSVLKRYAMKVLRRHKPFVVAITGSVGKTTTKEFTYKIFCDAFGKENVRANAGNLNAEIGIPLTVLGYRNTPGKFELIWLLVSAYFRTFVSSYPKYLILEMGVEHPGDIDYFCSIVKPNVGVVTAATPAHVVNFKDLKQMQSEKIKLLKYVTDAAIVNGDDEFMIASKVEALKYSIMDDDAECYSENIKSTVSGTNYVLIYNNKHYQVENKLLGKQMVYSQMAAYLAAVSSGIDLKNAAQSLNSLVAYPGRMNLIKGVKDIVIIDDTYNANPASSEAAIETLANIKHSGRKVLIHGNMNEQGSNEKQVHLDLGKRALGKVDLAVFVGQNAEEMQGGFGDKTKSIVYGNRGKLLKNIEKIMLPNDLVLIKASQNKNYFEEVTKLLMKDKNQAKNVLVRQSKNWLRKKR